MIASSTELKDVAKKWLAHLPPVYRSVSAVYRSSSLLRGISFLFEHRDKIALGAYPVLIDYPGGLSPRWSEESGGGHPGLARIIGENRSEYDSLLRSFGQCRASLEAIPRDAAVEAADPCWNNSYFQGLDAVALYGMLVTRRPKRYLEVGSGYSTKFARRAIRDQSLSTTITSIDPAPRASVDSLCDTVVRSRLEDTDLGVFRDLEPGDILFFDGSHYAFMSSDVVVLFLEILPLLRPGVLVHVHDIFLPYDYPKEWADRYYNEQYLLAMALMAPKRSLDVVFPARYIQGDPALSRLAAEQIGPVATSGGGSFWMRTRAA